MDHDTVTTLGLDECWELLRAQSLGRLAFHLAGEVRITPVNYVVDRDTLLFRTGKGSKMLGVLMNRDVAFEIDAEDGQLAWSVIVRGTAHFLDEVDARRADDLRMRPWVDTVKGNVVEITPTAISGRRFVLDEQARYPWLGTSPGTVDDG